MKYKLFTLYKYTGFQHLSSDMLGNYKVYQYICPIKETIEPKLIHGKNTSIPTLYCLQFCIGINGNKIAPISLKYFDYKLVKSGNGKKEIDDVISKADKQILSCFKHLLTSTIFNWENNDYVGNLNLQDLLQAEFNE